MLKNKAGLNELIGSQPLRLGRGVWSSPNAIVQCYQVQNISYNYSMQMTFKEKVSLILLSHSLLPPATDGSSCSPIWFPVTINGTR